MPSPQPLRLAILEADIPLPGTRAKYGTYGGVFASLFARAAAPAPLADVLSITYVDVVGVGGPVAYPPLSDFDAILITGSRYSVYDPNQQWIDGLVAYTREALATTASSPAASPPVRVVGVCFGHQVVGRALGVPVGPNPAGWEVSVTRVELSPAGVAFFTPAIPLGKGKEDADRDGSTVTEGPPTLSIHQMHRDAVLDAPAGAELLGSTADCPVQGLLLPGRAVTVQGHPEFDETIVREILGLRHEIGVFSEETYEGGMQRVGLEHDGVAVAAAFLRFLFGE